MLCQEVTYCSIETEQGIRKRICRNSCTAVEFFTILDAQEATLPFARWQKTILFLPRLYLRIA